MAKIITIGSSIGVVFPKPLVNKHGFAQGQEIEVNEDGIGRLIIERKRHTRSMSQTNVDLVKWAGAYVEKHRKDFEALADK